MTTVTKPAVKAMATAIAAALCAQLAYAVDPVVLWDGATASYNFSTLTRTTDGTTYTLNLNTANTAAADGSYVQIGNDVQKAAVTITADAVGAFGNNGKATVIMKCSDLNLSNSDGSNRGLIGLLADSLFANGDNSIKIGLANGNNNYSVGGYSCYIAEGNYHSYSQNSTAFTTGEQTICLTYDSASGTCIYRNGANIATSTAIKYGTWTTPAGIVLGGVDKDNSSKVHANIGMKIKAVAVFASTLTAEEVAAYKFPSESPMSTVSVSEINALFGSATEIDVYLADGATITGDTKFNASTVHFICDGSFTLTPPANNTAVFDFSNVTGQPIILYEGALPVASGTTFTSNTFPSSYVTDSTKWTGTIWLRNIRNLTDFSVNPYGNASSVVRLTGISGWVSAPGINSVPTELSNTGSTLSNGYALQLTNGNSANTDAPTRCTVFTKMLGNGSLAGSGSATTVTVVIQDHSEFNGDVFLENKVVVFGQSMPSIDQITAGSVHVMSGEVVTIRSLYAWKAPGGIKVDGELRTSGLNLLESDTAVITSDTGVFTLTSTGNGVETETDTSYARITGTGALKYEGAGWRALSATDFPTNMTLINEQAGDILLSRAQTYTIGSLAGSKNFQGNYGSGDRYLRVLQAKDTEWSGIIVYDYYDRFKGLIVAPGVSTNGTLTLSGTQIQSRTLTVESGAKVNLTGTWVGATTVNGTLSGTGTVDGPLTLADGSTLIANTADPLTVSSLSLPSTGTVTIALADSDIGKDFISCTGTIDTTGTTFAFTVNGEPTHLTLIKTAGGLKAVLPGMKIIFR